MHAWIPSVERFFSTISDIGRDNHENRRRSVSRRRSPDSLQVDDPHTMRLIIGAPWRSGNLTCCLSPKVLPRLSATDALGCFPWFLNAESFMRTRTSPKRSDRLGRCARASSYLVPRTETDLKSSSTTTVMRSCPHGLTRAMRVLSSATTSASWRLFSIVICFRLSLVPLLTVARSCSLQR